MEERAETPAAGLRRSGKPAFRRELRAKSQDAAKPGGNARTTSPARPWRMDSPRTCGRPTARDASGMRRGARSTRPLCFQGFAGCGRVGRRQDAGPLAQSLGPPPRSERLHPVPTGDGLHHHHCLLFPSPHAAEPTTRRRLFLPLLLAWTFPMQAPSAGGTFLQWRDRLRIPLIRRGLVNRGLGMCEGFSGSRRGSGRRRSPDPASCFLERARIPSCATQRPIPRIS